MFGLRQNDIRHQWGDQMRSLKQGLDKQLGSTALRFLHPLAGGLGSRRAGGLGRTLPGRRETHAGQVTGGRWRRERRVARLEAALFLAREPLNSRKLARFANLADGTEARTLIRWLNQSYNETGRAFRVKEFAGGFQLLTRRGFAPWLRRLIGSREMVRFSGPAMETLAVVAYRQPVLRAEIEAIRGVGCGEILRQLMDRSLVRIAGRADELGQPFLYGTTRRFLQVFGLRHLDELPRADILRKIGGRQHSQQNIQVDMAEEGGERDGDNYYWG